LFKCPESQTWREELVKSKWPHISKEITLRKILADKNTTYQRNLGTLAEKIKCKWENQAKKKN
jgi:hypothetical protein